ncbi:hypothetical protein [Paenibacillus sp. 1P03SA]|uniref:hypothetical protein n=1 Tax=Paenibacillus sp. 1P03SA TaxID=3132294 RepID=UPI0039A3CA7D
MNKTIISLAAFALLTSSVPAFAQANHTPTNTNTNETNILNPSEISVLNTGTVFVSHFNSPSSTQLLEFTVRNETDNILVQGSLIPKSQSQFVTYGLTRGKNYSIKVRALDAFYNQVATGTTGVFKVDTAEAHYFVYLN